ncbi:hypothetical protein [Streptomyces sp. 4F14]|uniref:hypothetical protein n=1 Tax=Streptomyces sp. 4F14 TaxID=3394380 RepID=UPI003A854B3B
MDTSGPPDGPLSDHEIGQFFELMRRYCVYELDQWENLFTETDYGPVYVSLARALPPGAPHEAYREF